MTLSYSWLGKNLAVDLANTVIDDLDGIANQEGLARWLELERDRLGPVPGARARLDDFRVVRRAVRGLLSAAAEGSELSIADIRAVNRASAAAPSFVQLHAPSTVVESRAAGAVDVALGQIAAAAIKLLGSPDRHDVRVCHAPGCGLFFVAGRGRQHWCSPSCGNRARVARHYARRRA